MDDLDTEFLAGPFELGHRILVLLGILHVHGVRAEAIEVDGLGKAVDRAIFAPEAHNGQDAFMGAEGGMEDSSRGVVDSGQETKLHGISVLQPPLIAPIELDELTHGLTAQSPGSMDLHGVSGRRIPEALLDLDATDRLGIAVDPVEFTEFFRGKFRT